MPDVPDIVLTPLRPADSASLQAWINARESLILNSAYRPVQPQCHDEWFATIQRRSDLVIFAIRTTADDALVGTCQLREIHPVHRSASLQIRIGEAAIRGRGFGTQALRALVRFGFADLNLHRIELQVFADNERAQATYRKLGFVEEGRCREAAWIDGGWVDLLTMGLLASDWQDNS